MAALAINLLALIIVLGLCWAAMMWLSGRFHGQRRTGDFHVDYWDETSVSAPGRAADSTETETGRASRQASVTASETPCTVCEGVGAQNSQGRLAPCPECYGTGVLSQ